MIAHAETAAGILVWLARSPSSLFRPALSRVSAGTRGGDICPSDTGGCSAHETLVLEAYLYNRTEILLGQLGNW